MSQSDTRDVALGLLRSAVEKSKRKEQVPFAKEFLRSDQDRLPLAQMIHGGRGGEVRLKIYLTITMMATRRPYDLKTPPAPQRWARSLGLTGSSSARRVTSNLAWLRDNKFIALESRAGDLPLITMLDPSGTGEPYVLPSERGAPTSACRWDCGPRAGSSICRLPRWRYSWSFAMYKRRATTPGT